jgi:hypothetical protein
VCVIWAFLSSDSVMALGSIAYIFFFENRLNCLLLIGSEQLPCWTARTGPPVGQDI